MGPIVRGTVVPNGARVPGTQFQLDPVQAAFNIGAMIRWLDFNDTWLAAEWGHPSGQSGRHPRDGRLVVAETAEKVTVRDVLTAMIKAHEIQGVLALENSFNRVGLDHVVLVKVASTAVVSNLLNLTQGRDHQCGVAGLGRRAVAAHLPPRAQHRLAQELGRGRRDLARGAPRAHRADRRDGLPLGAHRQGLGLLRRAVQGQAVQVPAPVRQLRHGERAVQDLLPGRIPLADGGGMRDADLHDEIKRSGQKIEDIKKISIRTHEAAIRIIDKKGPLSNPADRDHCIQYMVAVPLIFGRLTAADYEDDVAADPRIDELRKKMICVEDKRFTRDYHAPDKRSIANALTVEFKDGTKLKEVVCEYPIGHKRRRAEGMPMLVEKFRTNLARRFPAKQSQTILHLCEDRKRLDNTPVHEFVDLMVI